jgi:tetratricopeptide (TPR) repeat protein
MTLAETLGKFEPDMELVKKLAIMNYPDVVAELNKLPADKNLKYCLIMANVQNSRNNSKIAMQYCDRALEISQKNNLTECNIYFLKAFIYDNMTDRVETINNLDKATDCFRKNNDINSLKTCLSSLGGIEYGYGYFEKSLNAYKEALKICEETNDVLMEADILFEMGDVYYRISDIPNAKKVAEQAKTMFEKSGNTKGLADCLKLLGNTCLDNDKNKAKKYYTDACKLYEETNDHHGLANCYFNLGIMCSGLKEYTDSIEYLNRALRAYTKAGSVEGAGIANMELGRCYFLMKDYDKAEITLSQAEHFLNGVSQYRLAQTKDYQGDLYSAQDRLQQALDRYKISAELYKVIGMEGNWAIVEKKIKDLSNKIKSK